jgi:hypothetical protein
VFQDEEDESISIVLGFVYGMVAIGKTPFSQKV